MANDVTRVLIIEPFYGGSHKQLVDVLMKSLSDDSNVEVKLVTRNAKKWHWRARCAAIQVFDDIPSGLKFKTLFCSSVLNLCELIGLRPDLGLCHKVVYFHENQLVYPVQKTDECDFQYGYNQILTALAADKVYFNSEYNLTSFLNHVNSFLNSIPDYKPRNIKERIVSKSEVLYFPIRFLAIPDTIVERNNNELVHIVWAHRWEHDKDPKTFFDVLFQLKSDGFKFRVSVLGESFTQVPDVFEEAKDRLESDIDHFGYLESKNDYYSLLRSSDVAVSTAKHEFFGVSLMECAYCGCYPLCPNRLSYPELYPKECLYNTSQQLYKRLREFCRKPWLARELWKKSNMAFERYSWKNLQPFYRKALLDAK